MGVLLMPTVTPMIGARSISGIAPGACEILVLDQERQVDPANRKILSRSVIFPYRAGYLFDHGASFHSFTSASIASITSW
jgi:hypothetical protein